MATATAKALAQAAKVSTTSGATTVQTELQQPVSTGSFFDRLKADIAAKAQAVLIGFKEDILPSIPQWVAAQQPEPAITGDTGSTGAVPVTSASFGFAPILLLLLVVGVLAVRAFK